MNRLVRPAMHLILVVWAAAVTTPATAVERGPDEALFRAIYSELVNTNTTNSVGDTLKAAEAMAVQLRSGGLPPGDIRVLSSGPRKGNLVARLRGDGTLRPILLIAHIDVVEADRTDWAFDPFTLQEIDGFFRGRGTVDNKAMAAILVANLIRYHREGFRPRRDIVIALTADEEIANSHHNGVRWLLENHPDLIAAEFAINEGGSGRLVNGKPVRLSLQLAEKIYLSFRLEAKDRGGHSARPRRDTAINRLAEALLRLADHQFPPRLNAVTSAYLTRAARNETPAVREALRALKAGATTPLALAPLLARPAYSSLVRTTCVATLLSAGHAENALPLSARATVNCRLLPGDSADAVQATLSRVIADPKISVTRLGTTVESPPSPLSPTVLSAVQYVAHDLWPGVPIIPTQSSGYTDSRWLRRAGIPTYGVSGLFTERGRSGVHGLNEQIRVEDVFAGKQFLYRLVKGLADSEFSAVVDASGQAK